MRFLGIIPSRYQSSRFPGKSLCMIEGKTMIQRVYEQARQVDEFADVIVATDNKDICQNVLNFGGKVIMTDPSHQSGTERCAQVVRLLSNEYSLEDTVIVNIQGDEPFIKPEQIKEIIECFNDNTVEIATLIKEINDINILQNPNIVKAIISSNFKAIYFSRTPIPYLQTKTFHDHIFYKHIGIYAYRGKTLLSIVNLPPSLLEKAENLEQLRWIENNIPIKTHVTQFESTIAIDTPNDLEKAINYYKQHTL